MRVSAVILARVILFVESVDLNPRGAAYYPKIVSALIERYGFQKFPQKFEEFDESKGVTFEQGRAGNVTLDKLVIYEDGLQLDTSSSTHDSEAILEEALNWASKSLGLAFNRDMVRRKGYVSQFSFYSEAPLLQLNPIFRTVSGSVSRTVSENLHLPAVYEPISIMWGLDPAEQRIPAHSFSIERRQRTPFSEGKYFSAAPLPTDTHLALVEDFEKSVLSQKQGPQGAGPRATNNADYRIEPNATIVVLLSERAIKRGAGARPERGARLAFRTRHDAAEFVRVGEAEGFVFEGKEFL